MSKSLYRKQNAPMIFTILVGSAIALPLSAYFLRRQWTATKAQPRISVENMRSVLILGGSFGGVGMAHRLLKKNPDVKITLVSPTDSIYWNLACPRAIIPGGFADDKMFAAFGPGFKQYGDRFEFVLGSAEALDVETKAVTVKTEAGTTKTLSYDLLILATGSRTRDGIPYKAVGTTEETIAALHAFQDKVKNAAKIVVAGGGSSGVETSGELGYEYGRTKSITLIASGPTVLEGTPPSTSKTALSQLAKNNVTVKLSTKVEGSTTTPSGTTELTLSDGSKMTCDLYIPTTGLVPNSSYIPQNLLNHSGFVLVDEFLHVKGTTDVWAVGDVSSVEKPQYMNTEKQSTHVVKNIDLSFKGLPLAKYAVGGMVIMACPTGKKSGTGRAGNMKLPSFMVNMIKGKTYFTEKLAGTAAGTVF